MKNARKVILAVDDIIPSLNVIRKVLEDTFDVCLAKSIDMASMILKSNKVDLILLDIEMPEMSGFEYLKHLRQTPQYRDIPVIFVTSHATKEFIVQAMNSGAKDFIVKPVNPDTLTEKIYAALGAPEKTVSRELIEQMLADLKKACKKDMGAKASALIKDIRHKHFNTIADTYIAEICELVSQFNYKTAIEKMRLLTDNDFFEGCTENETPSLDLQTDEEEVIPVCPPVPTML
ncbi:MAG: response regulator [Spirochaetales bacterium]|jgi:putative two-component system response regulator|nr:response regulator [Spirochaetales bacterium]